MTGRGSRAVIGTQLLVIVLLIIALYEALT